MKQRQKTLEQLDGQIWPKPDPDVDTYLVITIHRLRQKPLEQFDTEDLRICIGQNMFLMRLIPIALEKLSANPMISGICYAGDLLLRASNRTEGALAVASLLAYG